MIFLKRISAITAVFTFWAVMAGAQNKPIGYWESHLPYNNALGVATDGNTLYTLCVQAFFTYQGTNPNASPEPFSKVEGMSDVGMQCVAYDMATSTAILVYSNGNIDLFKDNTFYNIPDLKVKTVAGNKNVNQIFTENGIAYLSTSLGVIVIDLTTHNINETFQFNLNNHALPVNSFVSSGNYFYAATQGGLYRADKNSPSLQNFQVWQRIDSVNVFTSMATTSNQLFMANHLSVFSLVDDTVQTVYTCRSLADTVIDTFIQHIDGGHDVILISEFHSDAFNGDIKLMNSNYVITDTFTGLGDPVQAVVTMDNSIWEADEYYGLKKITGKTSSDTHDPDGPTDPYAFDIYAHDKEVWIAHGGFNDLYYENGDKSGVSNYMKNGKWRPYMHYAYAPFDTLSDFVAVTKNEADGTVYMGTFQEGLFILKADGSYEIVNKGVFDSSNVYFDDNQRQVTAVALDQSGNVWVSAVAQHQIYARAASDGTWYKYIVPTAVNGGAMVIDDNGQAWFTSYSISGGVSVYNTNGTLDNLADDSYYHLSTGVGNGNLPSNKIFCLAKDKNNQIWIGTDNGIGIVSGCNPSVQGSPCDANIPIVQYDQFAGYLFAGNNVRTIAVDGANRKWVGTDAGVWLLSPNADKIIYRFTQDNSPLPSNNIEKISIDKVTGDVYIGTLQGVVSFHSTATEGGTANQDVVTFPNPVQSGYTGTIAIKGLVANADVRITDIDGQLVYKTKALGGQAVWNGKDYTGHRPQSGVYLIFASSSDGAQTYQGKIVFMQ